MEDGVLAVLTKLVSKAPGLSLLRGEASLFVFVFVLESRSFYLAPAVLELTM